MLGSVALAGLISACSTSSGPAVFSSDKHVGVYKVGQPYQIDGTWYTPKEEETYEEEGVASWYGPGFHKKLTANGDKFDQNALTAAHRTLPLPSMVRVTNLDNGRSLVVMVNDRGPFSKGRILDLSSRAADILGFKDKGLANVRVKYLPGQTRRLLSQLDIPLDQHKTNPFATADANFGHPDEEMMVASNAEVSSFADGLDLPLPDNFMVSDKAVGQVGVRSPQTAMEMELAEAGNEPIGLGADYNDSMRAFSSAVQKDVKTTARELPAVLPDDAVEPVKITSGQVNSKPLVVKSPELADADHLAVAQQDQSDFEVPEGKVLVDENDPRLVENVYFIQAGSFRMKENAERVQKSLSILGEKTEVETVEVAGANISRVRVGPFYNEDRAKIALQRVISMGHADAMMVGD